MVSFQPCLHPKTHYILEPKETFPIWEDGNTEQAPRLLLAEQSTHNWDIAHASALFLIFLTTT